MRVGVGTYLPILLPVTAQSLTIYKYDLMVLTAVVMKSTIS
jgi:hypothetical protein